MKSILEKDISLLTSISGLYVVVKPTNKLREELELNEMCCGINHLVSL